MLCIRFWVCIKSGSLAEHVPLHGDGASCDPSTPCTMHGECGWSPSRTRVELRTSDPNDPMDQLTHGLAALWTSRLESVLTAHTRLPINVVLQYVQRISNQKISNKYLIGAVKVDTLLILAEFCPHVTKQFTHGSVVKVWMLSTNVAPLLLTEYHERVHRATNVNAVIDCR